jgi:dipeptidyl aminopeptidase/acylaminoacyl peptidase
VIIYLSLFILFLILFSLYGFWVATHPPKYVTNLTPKDLGWEFEEVSLRTEDETRLAAWFVPSEQKSDKVVILLHGYPADKANLLNWSSFLHDDFDLFFLDFRYFGDSSGSLTTIGHREQKDLQEALNYLQEKGFDKMGVMGFSLGGAVGILTASKDARIKAIVSDSSFANIDLMGHQFYKNLFILKYPLTYLTKLWARVFVGINASDISPEKAAESLKIPVLIIHSKKDQTIPFENALRLKKALSSNPKAQFFFLEEGTHGYLPPKVLEDYQKKVLEFFKGYL